ncbi:MAG TPA: ABC transporter permease [Mycobacteriales bacterium]|nr:ABC transporter permease [Mycobacteriales bacterium]
MSGSAVSGPRPITLDRSGPRTSLRELVTTTWAARELVVLLAQREFFARYRRATLGVVWAVLLPLVQAVVLAIVFTKVARLHLPVNAFVFVFSGMAAWAFFSGSIGTASTAIVDGAGLSSKVYFPRIALPIVSVASNVYIAVVNAVILVIAAFVVGANPGVRLLLLLPAIALVVVETTAMAALLAGLHVYLRDLRYLVQAVLVLAFYLTPVFYPLTSAPTALRRVVEVNPLTGCIELYRDATIGSDGHVLATVGVSLAWTVALVIGALWVHCRFDRVFADLL